MRQRSRRGESTLTIFVTADHRRKELCHDHEIRRLQQQHREGRARHRLERSEHRHERLLSAPVLQPQGRAPRLPQDRVAQRLAHRHGLVRHRRPRRHQDAQRALRQPRLLDDEDRQLAPRLHGHRGRLARELERAHPHRRERLPHLLHVQPDPRHHERRLRRPVHPA